MAGVAVPTWQRYIRGEREPGALAVAKLAACADIDLDWLLLGAAADRGGASTQIDEDKLLGIIEVVEQLAAVTGRRPPPDKLASLIVHCYVSELRLAAANGAGNNVDAEAIRRAFRLVS